MGSYHFPMNIEVVGKYRATWGEGPVWWQGKLFYVDIEEHCVVSFDPTSGEEKKWDVGERVGFAVPRAGGGFVIGGDSGFRFLNEDGTIESIADLETDKPDNRLNDGKVSPEGELFGGSISLVKKEGDASLYHLSARGEVKKVFGEVTNSNGLVWSEDGTRVFYIDTPRREIWGFDYNKETQEWSNRTVVAKTDEIDASPDGMTIDADGHVWVAFCHGACVAQFDVVGGSLLQKIDLPCLETTSCAFGGANLDELYVTTGVHKSEVEEYAGRLLRITGLGVKGFPSVPFAG